MAFFISFMKFNFLIFILLFLFYSCDTTYLVKQNIEEMNKPVNSSYSNTDFVRTTHLDLDLQINFASKTIKGIARHQIQNLNHASQFIVDTKELEILKVTKGLENEIEIDYELGAIDSIYGSPLIIDITPKDTIINIYYKTTPSSEALGWIEANQTQTNSPFLYTQGEAILTRSWIPLQDIPSNKITYSADVHVPDSLLALMSASNPQEKNNEGVYHFEMNKPISSYLIALTVGDISFRAIDDRTGVYAETPIVDAVYQEMSDMPKMLKIAEELCGPYEWNRYDVVVLPNSFPFGGMENPMLTFLTPTIIVGDKSLVAVTAHELAHSWSGNLVTNKTWSDFWLNEGWTVYIEHRIMEALHGRDFSDALSVIEWHEYLIDKEYAEKTNQQYLNSLYVELDGLNPDDGMTSVPYGRGAFFFKTLEQAVGRPKFDAFLKKYFEDFKFNTIDTKEFLTYIRSQIKGVDQLINLDEWIYTDKIPSKIYKASTKKMKEMEAIANYLSKHEIHQHLVIKNKKYQLTREAFTTQEWMHLLRSLPRDMSRKKMSYIDKYIDFNNWNNAEIQTEWFLLSIDANYRPAYPAMEKFLSLVGRRKFLQPLYVKLAEKDKDYARKVFEQSKRSYHSVSISTIEEIVK